MDAAALRDALIDLARRIKARSASASVDGWADEIVGLAGLVPAVVPTIAERRKPGADRRTRDVIGMGFGNRARQRRANAQRFDVVTKIAITSQAPINFVPTNTHQLLAEARNILDAAVSATLTYSSSDTNIATVNASGLVTAVATGSAVITVTITGSGISATSTYTVTSPQSAVNSVVVAPTSGTVTVGSTLQLAATVKDAANNTLTGKTVTWASDNTPDATVGADSGTEAHTATVTGVSTGSANITATCETVNSTAVAVTVSAVSGFTDGLGIVHPNCPATFTPIIGRLYGSTKQQQDGATAVQQASTRYWKGFCENYDDAAEFIGPVVTDATAPHQAERAVLYPGNGTRCAHYRLSNGAVGNNSFARAGTFETTSATRYPGLNFNQLWRAGYWRTDFKLLPDFPNRELTKFQGFISLRGGTNDAMLQLRSGASNGSSSTPIQSLALNMQGRVDNNLTDNRQLTPDIWQSGFALTHQAATGDQTLVELTRNVWYRLERLEFIGTPSTRDGWTKIWLSSSADPSGGVWSTPVLLAYLPQQLNGDAGSPGTQAYISNIAPNYMLHFTWNGGYDSGLYVALDFWAMSTTEP